MSNFLKLLALILVISFQLSCKKDSPPNPSDPASSTARKIQFELYTTQDFSTDNHIITFTLHIKNQNGILWDSVLQPMKVKDIPAQANKISVVKQVPGDNGKETLAAGFLYTIQNVGMSWYLDTCKSGDTLKLVSYDFH